MEVLETELGRLQRDATLSQSVEDVDKILMCIQSDILKTKGFIKSKEDIIYEIIRESHGQKKK